MSEMMVLESTTIESTGELQHAEERIERMMRHAWYETALEYQRIRDKDLYKQQGWGTWAEYCQERWGRSQPHIDQQIARAVEVKEIVEISTISMDQLPASMSHATALSKLDKPEQRGEVWLRVLESANGRGITAKMVQGEVERKIAELEKNWITLTDWNALTTDKQQGILAQPHLNKKAFNSVNENIEWAAWSWNPVTGCLHNCDYCYARDIAERFYPQKFEPSFIPERLTAPANTNLGNPRWQGDTGHINVFTCSMADLFGKWVPDEWIHSVLDVIQESPQWQFLLLTKFPIRMAEFEYPDNVWLGTSVDYQWAVERAEKAFAKVRDSGFGGVSWLSCEPMMEQLTFSDLTVFDWVVMGGSSKSTQTPEYRPPFEDIVHLHNQIRDAGCMLYQKTNLIPGMSDVQRVREFPVHCR